jgi:hypothetical protein
LGLTAAYVNNLSDRIEESFKEGNFFRAVHLSKLLTDLITTGGGLFTIGGPPADPTEMQHYNRAAVMLAKNIQIYSELHNQGPEVQWRRRTDMCMATAQGQPEFVQNHAIIFNTMILAHMKIGSSQSTLETVSESINAQIASSTPIDLKKFITPVDCKNARTIYELHFVPRTFEFYKGGRIHDYVRGVSFELRKVSPDGNCFFTAAGGDTGARARFDRQLRDLDPKSRSDAARFMTNSFTILLQKDSKLKNTLCSMSKDLKSALDKLEKKEKEYSELDLKIPHTPHNHQEYRRVENKFIDEINALTVQLAHPLSQQNIFNTIIAKDFPDGQWQTEPDRVSQARYSDLYAYLHKINIVTLSLSEYSSEYGDISKKSFLRRTVRILQSYWSIFYLGAR